VREKAKAARAAATQTYTSARAKATTAAQRAVDEPVVALVGGLAIGAIAGALLPASRKEAEILGPIGSRLNETARVAASAAREAGQETLDELGINRDAAREQASRLMDAAMKAASSAGAAAAKAVRGT
jgi:predicted lipid-binding transport protein (Tim44 family)